MTGTHDPEPPATPDPRSRGQRIGLWLGPLLAALTLLFLDLEPGRPEVTRMAAVALLMATWWITDAIPLYATALLPLILYPLLGIERTRATAPIYFNSTIVLFLGGFMIALTMEKWDVHRRIALWVIRSVGGGPARIVLGFMLAAAFLSMWISNTATAIMMLPVGLAVILRMEEQFGRERTRAFSVAVMLGIAYACSAGGIATLVGTPPNLSLQRIFQITFPEAPHISFGVWFVMAAPITLIVLACAWVLITQVFFRIPRDVAVDREVLESEARKLGEIRFEERVILAVFAATAVLWVFRAPIVIGGLTIPGWSGLLPFGHLIDDGTVAITMACLLFLVPARSPGAQVPDADGSPTWCAGCPGTSSSSSGAASPWPTASRSPDWPASSAAASAASARCRPSSSSSSSASPSPSSPSSPRTRRPPRWCCPSSPPWPSLRACIRCC